MRRRASRIKLALNAPHSPRLAVMTTSATRRLFPRGWRSKGNRSASSGAYRSPITSASAAARSEEHTSELQSHSDLVCRLLLEKKKKKTREPKQNQTRKKHSENDEARSTNM